MTAPDPGLTGAARTWDIGDPEPEGVICVIDTFHSDPDSCNHNRWGRTERWGWKGYLDGKTYLGWDELVRRFGPVREAGDDD